MKINPGFRPLGPDMRVGDPVAKPVTTKSFADMMQQQGRDASNEQLQLRLQEIHQQGERLGRSMTIRELHLYKTMVKRFLEDTVRRGVALKDTRGWDRRGRSRRYRLVEEIDEVLLALADELLQTEQGKIDLLNKVGEIRGMLINLTF